MHKLTQYISYWTNGLHQFAVVEPLINRLFNPVLVLDTCLLKANILCKMLSNVLSNKIFNCVFIVIIMLKCSFVRKVGRVWGYQPDDLGLKSRLLNPVCSRGARRGRIQNSDPNWDMQRKYFVVLWVCICVMYK